MLRIPYVPLVLLIFIAIKIVQISGVPDYLMDFERVETNPGTSRSLVNISVEFKRNAQRERCMSGYFNFLEDFGNDVIVTASFALSTLGNNNFVQSRIRVPPTPYCEFVNKTWRELVQPSLDYEGSQFPRLPPEGLCPYPKGVYTFDCITINKNVFPNHVPRGLWRIILTHRINDEDIGGYTDYLTVSNK